MKWLVLVVVVILAAPTIARRLEELNPDNAAKRAGSATAITGTVCPDGS